MKKEIKNGKWIKKKDQINKSNKKRIYKGEGENKSLDKPI